MARRFKLPEDDEPTGTALAVLGDKAVSGKKALWSKMRRTVKRRPAGEKHEFHGLKGATLDGLSVPIDLRTDEQVTAIASWIEKRHKRLMDVFGSGAAGMESLMELCRHMKLRLVPPHTIVMQQGSVGDKAFLVLSGSCDVYRLRDPSNPDAKEHTIFKRTAPEIVLADNSKDLCTITTQIAAMYKASKAELADQIQAEFDKVQRLQAAAAAPAAPKRRSNRRASMAPVSQVAHSKVTGETLTGLLLGPDCKVRDRSLLGEHIAHIEEGSLIGELALFRSDSRRAGSVVANGRYNALRSGNDADELPDETILVEIPHDVFARCLRTTSSVDLPRRLRQMHRTFPLRRMIETDYVSVCYQLLTLHYRERQLICRSGQRSSYVYLVHKGRVALRSPARMTSEDSVLKRQLCPDLEIVTALGMIGDWEVITKAENYLYDAVALTDTVVLAWPRETFALAVHPEVNHKSVKLLADDLFQFSKTRHEWRCQREIMCHPIHITPSMQLGAVPCTRCGSTKHVTTSMDCPKLSDAPSMYDTNGRMNSTSAAKKRMSFFSSSLDPTRMPPGLGSTKKPGVEESKEESKDAERSPRKPAARRPRRPATDLSPFPNLSAAVARCQKVWEDTGVMTSALRDSMSTLKMAPGGPVLPAATPTKPETRRRSVLEASTELEALLDSTEVKVMAGSPRPAVKVLKLGELRTPDPTRSPRLRAGSQTARTTRHSVARPVSMLPVDVLAERIGPPRRMSSPQKCMPEATPVRPRRLSSPTRLQCPKGPRGNSFKALSNHAFAVTRTFDRLLAQPATTPVRPPGTRHSVHEPWRRRATKR